jgi:AraC-like DNA-binding protein
MSSVGRIEGRVRPEMLGVYFRPARAAALLGAPMPELTDRAVAIDTVRGSMGSRLAGELAALDEGARLARLEAVLLGWKRPTPPAATDFEQLAAGVVRCRGRVTVETMAQAAGVSRQHLTREFRRRFGIGPKLYCRLARFQSGLQYVGLDARRDWARASAELGYADQSHMIAEFRQFSSLTPQALSDRYWFHPFIERAKRGA